jgi:hypothetical protein
MFYLENLKRKVNLADVRMILREALKKLNAKFWIGFNLFKIELK